MLNQIRTALAHRRLFQLTGIAGLFFALCAWALASPVGASPDEDFHLVSIWCANDGYQGMCESTEDPSVRKVSPGLIDSACFGRKAEVSATCQSDLNVFTSTELVSTDRGNFAGGYPGGFYAVMRVFASPNIQLSVIVMRMMNALLFCTILGLITALSRPKLAGVALTTASITLVPLGLFVVASINPSSWAITAIFATFFGAFEFFKSRGGKQYVWAALAISGFILAATARFDAMLYAGISLVIASFVSSNIRLKPKPVLLTLGALVVCAGVGLAIGGTAVVQTLINSAGTTGHTDSSPMAVFFYNVATLPELFAGFSGQNGLGWLDTEMPPSTWLVATVLLWGVLFSRFRFLSGRPLHSAITVAVLLVAVPMGVLQLSNATIGQNVQARYLFPLLLVLVCVVLTGARGPRPDFNTLQKAIIITGLTLSQVLAIFFNMSRYISGGRFPVTANLNSATSLGWWWEFGPSPMTVVAASVIGFSVFLWLSYFPPRTKRLINTKPIAATPAAN